MSNIDAAFEAASCIFSRRTASALAKLFVLKFAKQMFISPASRNRRVRLWIEREEQLDRGQKIATQWSACFSSVVVDKEVEECQDEQADALVELPDANRSVRQESKADYLFQNAQTESKKLSGGHSCSFPVEIAELLIKNGFCSKGPAAGTCDCQDPKWKLEPCGGTCTGKACRKTVALTTWIWTCLVVSWFFVTSQRFLVRRWNCTGLF